jgi:signal transduction histidine kinase
VIPMAMINADKIMPPGRTLPKLGIRPIVKFGEPLDFSRYKGMENDRAVLRAITDEVMYALMDLSGQEYVDRYAQSVKDELAKVETMAAELEKNERERKAHDQKRDHFITNISHELRTPLTAMQGFLEALQDGVVQDETSRQRYYKVMYQESMYLNRLVDDLMDLIKLEKGEVHLEHEWVHMGEIAEKVAFTLQPNAQQKKNKVEVYYSRDLPPIWADPVRVEQIFINLIQNANKFTDKGRITVRLKSFGKNVRITIADTGVGIPSHDLPKIWDRFFKVKRDRSKKEGGTGLGLAIVKELVDLHGGSIDVMSELGKGTTFTLTIPFRKQ